MQNNISVLVYEKHEQERTTLIEELNSFYKIITIDCCHTGLDILSKNTDISVVICNIDDGQKTDLQMYECIKKMQLCMSAPIFVTTCQDREKVMNEFIPLGVMDVISKPINPKLIKYKVDNICGILDRNRTKHDTSRDKLTGLYNRSGFYNKVSKIIAADYGTKYAILCMNIERFKMVNELFGNVEGDKLLQYCARALKENIKLKNTCIARLTSDNFAVFLPHTEGFNEQIVAFAQADLNKYPLNINIVVRFGLYVIDDILLPVSVMCDRANIAISSIKGKYNASLAIYDASHRKKLFEQQEIIDEMNKALEDKQFKVFLQPKIDFTSGKIMGAEALVRWVHPTKGIIPPINFIPIFEKNGFITRLDIYVWNETCRIIADLRKKGVASFNISVNVSRIDIYNPKLIEILLDAVHCNNLEPEDLEIEITESAYTDNSGQLIEVCKKLRNHGFSVQMDDFGTGYSSLNMLNDVPVDVLKLDMRFLQGSNENTRSGNILYFIISMAKWMKIMVVAEGVETVTQIEYLRSMGCNSGQGYYFAQPLNYEDFIEFCKKNGSQKKTTSQVGYMTTIDENEIWKPNSEFNNLFNSFIGALGIVQWENNQLTFVRVNDTFYKVTDLTAEEIFKHTNNILDLYGDNDKQLTTESIQKLLSTNGEDTFDGSWMHPVSKNKKWLHAKLKVLANSNNRAIMLVSIEDVTKEREAAIALKVNEARLKSAVAQAVDNMWEYDISNKTAYRFSKSITGFGLQEPLVNIPESLIESGFVHPDSADDVREVYERINNGESNISKILKMKGDDGEYSWKKLSYSTVYDDDNNKIRAVGTIKDASIEVAAMQQFEHQCDFYRSFFSGSAAYLEVDLTHKKLVSASEEIFKCTQSESGCDLIEFYEKLVKLKIHPDDIPTCNEILYSNHRHLMANSNDTMYFEHRYDCSDAEEKNYKWCASTINFLKNPTCDQVLAFVAMKYLDKEKSEYTEYKSNAGVDALTKLYNRASFTELTQKVIQNNDENKSLSAFIVVSLADAKDGKKIHCDKNRESLLIKIAAGMQAMFRAGDLIARTDEDEFGIVVTNIPSIALAHAKGAQLSHMISKIAASRTNNSVISAIGIALIPIHGNTFETLYYNAQLAVCCARELSENRCCLYGAQPSSPRIGAYVDKERLVEELDDMVCISDAENYELLFLNEAGVRVCNAENYEYLGKMCYNVLHGRSEPCPNCDSSAMSYDKTYCHEVRNKYLSKTFINKEKLISWNGRPAKFCLSIDITDGQMRHAIADTVLRDMQNAEE